MTKAKKKYRQMKRKEKEASTEQRQFNREKMIIRKMTLNYSRYAEMEDYKRGRLL